MTLTEFLDARAAEDRARCQQIEATDGPWGYAGELIAALRHRADMVDALVGEWREFHYDGGCRCDPVKGSDQYGENHFGHADAMSLALRAAAVAWSDHPDYNDAWRL